MVCLSLQRLAHGLMLQLVILTDPICTGCTLHTIHLHGYTSLAESSAHTSMHLSSTLSGGSSATE